MLPLTQSHDHALQVTHGNLDLLVHVGDQIYSDHFPGSPLDRTQQLCGGQPCSVPELEDKFWDIVEMYRYEQVSISNLPMFHFTPWTQGGVPDIVDAPVAGVCDGSHSQHHVSLLPGLEPMLAAAQLR